MIQDRLLERIRTSPADEVLNALILLDLVEEMETTAGIENRAARDLHWSEAVAARRGLLETVFGPYRELGLATVNEMNGAPMMVIEAPADVWRTMVEERMSLTTDPKVNLSLNEAVWTIA